MSPTTYSNLACHLLLAAGLASGLAAERVELPVELPLDAASVVIELHDADVNVLADPTARPLLVVRPAGDEPLALDRVTNDGVLEIRRATDETARLEVDVVAGAEQEVRLEGRNLTVVTRESLQPGVTAPRGLRLVLESSELDMEGGRDAVVEARETSIRLARTRGLLNIGLEIGFAEVLAHDGGLELEAREAQVYLEELAGPVETRLDGGGLRARTMAGKLTVKATNRADVELTDLARGAVLELSEGSAARLTGVSGDLEAVVDDSRLLADGIERLTLTGARSEIRAGEIGTLTRLEARDPELELALAAGARDASITLLGTGRASVRLPAPCRVRIDRGEAPVGSGAEITGCELFTSTRGQRLIYGDRPPLTLTVTLGDGVELVVEGEL